MKHYVRVAVKFPTAKSTLTYLQDEAWTPVTGQLVEVPLGKRKAQGCVIEHGLTRETVQKEIEGFKIKKIGSPLDEDFFLSPKEIEHRVGRFFDLTQFSL